jgi:hypothetical protein
VVGGHGALTVRLRGELRGGGIDAKLKVNGEAIRRLPAAAGYHFDQEVAVAASARELILTADDQAGDQTILALPILN